MLDRLQMTRYLPAHVAHHRHPLTSALSTSSQLQCSTPVPSRRLPIRPYQLLLLVEELGLREPIRNHNPTHMPLLARCHCQADHRRLRNRDHVVTGTPHTTLPPTPYTCPPPARRLSGRTTVLSPLCSQPRVVSTRCIGSRRPPPPDRNTAYNQQPRHADTAIAFSILQSHPKSHPQRLLLKRTRDWHNEGGYSMRRGQGG